MDILRRKFLWQGNKEKRGFNLVKWKTLTLAKYDGGLGIRNLIEPELTYEMALEIHHRRKCTLETSIQH